jgi:hypothetical protein
MPTLSVSLMTQINSPLLDLFRVTITSKKNDKSKDSHKWYKRDQHAGEKGGHKIRNKKTFCTSVDFSIQERKLANFRFENISRNSGAACGTALK